MFSTRILFLYILREQVKVLILAAGAITLVMNFGAVLVYMNQYPWIPLGSLVKILPYHTPLMFPWIFPLAVLMSTTLTYGRLASDNEILAIQMCGMHLVRPVFPAIVMGLTVMGLLFAVNDRVLPWCRLREYRVYVEESDRILVRLFETQSRLKGGDFMLSWEGYRDRSLHHVTVRQRQGRDPVAEYTARVATFTTDGEAIILQLQDITGTHFRDDIEIKWPRHEQRIPLEGVFTHEPGYKALGTFEMIRSLNEEYLPAIENAVDDEQRQELERRARNLLIRIHRRFSLPAAALSFAVIGVALGLMARQSHMLSAFFLGCLPVMLLYYPLFLLGHSMAVEGAVSVAAGCWIPASLLGTMGLGLLGWLFVR